MNPQTTFLHDLWSVRVDLHLVPVLAALALTEAVTWARRRFSFFYGPFYAPFLLSELNPDLSVYFGTDYLGRGLDLTKKRAAQLRRRIQIIAALSSALSVLGIPLLLGLVLAAFLEPRAFVQYLAVVTVYRAWRCYLSYRNFGRHATGARFVMQLLVFLYAAYVGIAASMSHHAYSWARPFVEARNWLGMLGEIGDLIFVKSIVSTVFVAGLGALFANLLTDPQVRDEQIRRLRKARRKAEKKVIRLRAAAPESGSPDPGPHPSRDAAPPKGGESP